MKKAYLANSSHDSEEKRFVSVCEKEKEARERHESQDEGEGEEGGRDRATSLLSTLRFNSCRALFSPNTKNTKRRVAVRE